MSTEENYAKLKETEKETEKEEVKEEVKEKEVDTKIGEELNKNEERELERKIDRKLNEKEEKEETEEKKDKQLIAEEIANIIERISEKGNNQRNVEGDITEKTEKTEKEEVKTIGKENKGAEEKKNDTDEKKSEGEMKDSQAITKEKEEQGKTEDDTGETQNIETEKHRKEMDKSEEQQLKENKKRKKGKEKEACQEEEIRKDKKKKEEKEKDASCKDHSASSTFYKCLEEEIKVLEGNIKNIQLIEDKMKMYVNIGNKEYAKCEEQEGKEARPIKEETEEKDKEKDREKEEKEEKEEKGKPKKINKESEKTVKTEKGRQQNLVKGGKREKNEEKEDIPIKKETENEPDTYDNKSTQHVNEKNTDAGEKKTTNDSTDNADQTVSGTLNGLADCEEPKLKEEKEKKFLYEFFHSKKVDPDVDIWTPLEYMTVEATEMIEVEDEDSNVNRMNELKESAEEMNKRRLQRMFRDSVVNGKFEEKEKEKAQQKPAQLSNQESGGTKPKMLNVIDKPFILIPLKGILNTFRLMQKELEKNIMIITLFIEKKLLHLPKDVTIQKLNTIIEKLTALKSKINESRMSLNKSGRSLYRRLESIYQEADIQLESLKKDFQFETYENRLNWIIDEYLSRYGYFESEEIFCKRYQLEDYTDVDVYKEYACITKELKNRNITPALDWCQKYKSQLKKLNIDVEAELHLLSVINLISKGKFVESIFYIQKNVTDPGKKLSSSVKHLITHIGLNRDSNSLEAIENKGWKRTMKKFKKVYSEITGMVHRPILELLLKAGISVIKTENCGVQKSTKCPTCIDELKCALQTLPSIQKTRSFLICPYTNEVMDEDNPPYTTPSGHVFSKKAIYLFSKVDGVFECPITEETHRFSEFSRLFI